MLTGHHEVMFPLLAAAVREELAGATSKPRAKKHLMPSRSPRRKNSSRADRADRAAHRLRLSRSLCRCDEGRHRHHRAECARHRHHAWHPAAVGDRGSDRARAELAIFSEAHRCSSRSSIRASAPRASRSRSKLDAGARFVGPDNGVLYLAAKDAGIRRIVELRAPKYRLKKVSSTFHGRDIFAPAAAWLSRRARRSRRSVRRIRANDAAIDRRRRSGAARRSRARSSMSMASATW